MRRHTFALVTASLAAALGISSIPQARSAEDGRTKLVSSPAPSYNPYPPGILPSDLDSEIARIERETQFIFNEALDEWRALPLRLWQVIHPHCMAADMRRSKYSAS